MVAQKIYYTAPEDALSLSYSPAVNAGIDLYPYKLSYSLPENVDASFFKVLNFNDNGLTLLVNEVPFIFNIDTGYRIALPEGTHAIVYGRSGNFFKRGVDVFKGVIDSSYRGSIVVGLIFYNRGVFEIRKNVAIAQLVLTNTTPLELVRLSEEEFLANFINTERGEKGFGSSGYIR